MDIDYLVKQPNNGCSVCKGFFTYYVAVELKMDYARGNISFPNNVSKTQCVPLISTHAVMEVQSEIILIILFL